MIYTTLQHFTQVIYLYILPNAYIVSRVGICLEVRKHYKNIKHKLKGEKNNNNKTRELISARMTSLTHKHSKDMSRLR